MSTYNYPQTRVSDFAVGESAFVLNSGNGWSTPSVKQVTVTKILKTRIVVKDSNGREQRFVIPTYGYSFDLEGTKSDYRRSTYLVGKDDSRIESIREQAAKERVENAAVAAVNRTIAGGHISTENAEATIAALTALVASRKEA